MNNVVYSNGEVEPTAMTLFLTSGLCLVSQRLARNLIEAVGGWHYFVGAANRGLDGLDHGRSKGLVTDKELQDFFFVNKDELELLRSTLNTLDGEMKKIIIDHFNSLGFNSDEVLNINTLSEIVKTSDDKDIMHAVKVMVPLASIYLFMDYYYHQVKVCSA